MNRLFERDPGAGPRRAGAVGAGLGARRRRLRHGRRLRARARAARARPARTSTSRSRAGELTVRGERQPLGGRLGDLPPPGAALRPLRCASLPLRGRHRPRGGSRPDRRRPAAARRAEGAPRRESIGEGVAQGSSALARADVRHRIVPGGDSGALVEGPLEAGLEHDLACPRPGSGPGARGPSASG